MEATLFRTDYYTERDKKTNKIKKQTACEVWVYPDWSYKLVFKDIKIVSEYKKEEKEKVSLFKRILSFIKQKLNI